jgi:hypothetical protein
MPKMNCSKLSIFFFVGILLFGGLVFAEENVKEDELEEVEYYFEEDKIPEFLALSNDDKNKVLESAGKEQKRELFEKITNEIYLNKVYNAGGPIAGRTETVTDVGEENANYPPVLDFVGFDNPNLKWSGDDDKTIISDGNVFLNLEEVPEYITEIEYRTNGKNESVFVLKDKDGGEISLEKGSTDENGDISFFSKREGKIGDQRFSSDLNDYKMTGKVRITEDGFVLEDTGSKVEYEGYSFLKSGKSETGEFRFTDDGVELTGGILLKEGKFAARPKDSDEPFLVVFGADRTPLLGEREYQGNIDLEDYQREFSEGVTMDGSNGQSGHYNVPKGELTIIPSVDGSSVAFGKDVDGKYLIVDPNGMSLKQLKASAVYKESSSAVQKMMEGIAEDPSNANMEYVQSQVYDDLLLRKKNGEAYKEFLSVRGGFTPIYGMGVSEGADGKTDIVVTGGADINVYSDVDQFTVVGMDRVDLNINAKAGGVKSGLIFEKGKTSKKGPGGTFEFGVDEIRLMGSSGKYDPLKSQAIVLNDDTGDWEWKKSNKVTVSNALFNPYANSLVVNDGEITRDLDLPVGSYISGLESAQDKVARVRAEVTNVADFMRNAKRYYDEDIPMEQKAETRKMLNDQLAALKKMDSLPPRLMEKVKLLPDSLPVIKPEVVDDLIEFAEYDTGALLDFANSDIQQLKKNPLVAEVKLEVNRFDLNSFGGNIEDFGDDMAGSRFDISVAVRTPELESIQAIQEQPIVGGHVSATMDFVGFVKDSAIKSTVAETLVDGMLSHSGSFPGSTVQATLGTEVSTEKEIILKQTYRTELRDGILNTMTKIDLQGETRLNIRNVPGEQRVDITLVSGGKEYPVDFPSPESRVKEMDRKLPSTETFIHDSIVLGFSAPDPDLTGYLERGSDDPRSSAFWNPYEFSDAYDSPVISGNYFRDFCNSVGYRPGPCSEKTEKRATTWLNNYYLQSVDN